MNTNMLGLLLLTLISINHAQGDPSGGNNEDVLSSQVPNSCINQADNDNVIVKPLDGDSYPLINTKCSNEYMIVDLNKDELWKSYLSSSREYHYNLIGPVKDDHANWQEWMIPEMEDFLVSPDCASCDAEFELNAKYSTSSAYYMTPVAAGCTQLPIGRIGCDMDWHTYSCRVCETAQTREPGYWMSYEVYNGLNDPERTIRFEDEIEGYKWAKYGLCGFTIRDAKAEHAAITDTFEHCKSVTYEDIVGEEILPRRKPSIGQDGRFCMCVKPKQYELFDVSSGAIMDKQRDINNINVAIDADAKVNNEPIAVDKNVVRLYQKDFEKGTYRITEPGKYLIMEDIIFDFKAPEGYKEGNLDSYNEPEHWWPTSDQIEDYPGAGDLSNAYFLGFWAGITIECNDVILELNHHTLAMSEAFYYQQSFFAIISLTSQVFLPSQGPGFFGAAPQAAENVMIRNGALGLSSHHGIQGNFNKHVFVENVRIYDFKTHGIQFNGFDGVTMKNVDVGPNRKVDKLTPFYAHMKALLPVYRMMVENEAPARDVCFNFRSPGRDDECVYLNDLIQEVQTLLDMAFEYVVLDKDYDALNIDDYEDDEDMKKKLTLWAANRDVLINDHESTQTATLYGIFLNYIGSNVIGWYAGSPTTKSQNVVMDNVRVHDLHHDTYENIAFSQGWDTAFQRILNCLNAPFSAYHIFGDKAVNEISECNNYMNEDEGDSPKCAGWREEGLEYYGNKITDIQIISFELINHYGLSWNYCTSGAADMAALADFALRGKQWDDYTPLLVGSHDPMIHPGKGVIGMRLNGVDNVAIKNLKIDNIHSSTNIGSLLGGSYTNVVSQQAPYMNGFSMNMVNGFTATFSRNIEMDNVEVSHIVSNTGLSYGVAAWYETHINIIGKKGLKISNVHAGLKLAPSEEYKRDSYPNLKPEGCAFRVYDDVIYRTVVKSNSNAHNDDNVHISCVSGHAGCLFENNKFTIIGQVDECSDEEQQDMEQFQISNELLTKQSSSNHIGSATGKSTVFSSILIIGIIALVISVFLCYYQLSTKQIINANGDKSEVFELFHPEHTPLLA